MKITIELPDEMVPCYEQWIYKYFSEMEYDKKTGAGTRVPQFTVEQFVVHQIDQLSDRIDDEFPPAHTAEIRAQAEALRTQAKQSIRAQRIEDIDGK
jgi:hypothetical protein